MLKSKVSLSLIPKSMDNQLHVLQMLCNTKKF